MNEETRLGGIGSVQLSYRLSSQRLSNLMLAKNDDAQKHLFLLHREFHLQLFTFVPECGSR
jgi:hypothetical protein